MIFFVFLLLFFVFDECPIKKGAIPMVLSIAFTKHLFESSIASIPFFTKSFLCLIVTKVLKFALSLEKKKA